MQEGAQQGTNDEYQDEGLCSLSFGAQEVQDVLEEKEPCSRESRLHDPIEHGFDGVAAYNDDDENADTLEGLLNEGRDE